jgi:hypothetical protein
MNCPCCGLAEALLLRLGLASKDPVMEWTLIVHSPSITADLSAPNSCCHGNIHMYGSEQKCSSICTQQRTFLRPESLWHDLWWCDQSTKFIFDVLEKG